MDDLTSAGIDRALMLDGNAAASALIEVFGVEMTANPTKCNTCGHEGEIGALLAFTQGPGIVLRCPVCNQVVLRVVESPEAILLDARGAVYLRLQHRHR